MGKGWGFKGQAVTLWGTIATTVRTAYIPDSNDVHKNCTDPVGEEGGAKHVGHEFLILPRADHLGGYQSNG